MIKIIAAVGRNMELGKNNQLLWRLATDMKFFRTTTLNHTVVMGRKTFESIGRPLSGRKNIVISRNPDLSIPGVSVVNCLDSVVNIPDCFVIGGANIYAQAIKYADEIILTEIDKSAPEADVFFPDFNRKQFHKTILNQGIENNIPYVFARYTRIR